MPFRKPAPLGKPLPSPLALLDWGHPVTRGLVCRLPLNERGAQTRHDIARSNVAGSQNFSLIQVTGPYGTGLSFDNNASAGWLKLSKPLVAALPVTLMGWIYNATGTANGRLLTIADEATDNEWLTLYIDNSNGFANANSCAAGTNISAIGATDVRNKWTQVAAVFASTTDRKVYVNGRLDGSDTTANAPNFATFDSVGCGALQRSTTLYGYGVVSNLSIWNRALSPGEIRWLFNNPWGDLLAPRRRISKTPPVGTGASSGRMFLTY